MNPCEKAWKSAEKKEGKKELVLQMLSDGRYSIEEIAALSGFSVDEVKLLQESQMS